jgi:hypothetical protein
VLYLDGPSSARGEMIDRHNHWSLTLTPAIFHPLSPSKTAWSPVPDFERLSVLKIFNGRF